MKRFQLTLDEELFDDFRRYYFGHGIRQTVLRQAVRQLVKRAKEKYKITGEVVVDPDDLLPDDLILED